jgi:hypothetical protein
VQVILLGDIWADKSRKSETNHHMPRSK